MPLSNPVKRQQIHTREVRCVGYQREDGLWDIEGQITDTKGYSFENHDRGVVGAGSPVHDMWVRFKVDDDLLIHEAEAVTDSSPFTICPNIAPRVEALVGLNISSGFTRAARERLGGTNGCTHILQLIIGPLATTAFQTIIPRKMHAKQSQSSSASDLKNASASQPQLLNTCYAFASDSAVVKRNWPDYYTGK
ncbi:MAG: DUF2889 domain-containing protein [Proteobacteria bacterium]|nr:DUF2889 domain-containing protein [Pseudomonadota bacterium]